MSAFGSVDYFRHFTIYLPAFYPNFLGGHFGSSFITRHAFTADAFSAGLGILVGPILQAHCTTIV